MDSSTNQPDMTKPPRARVADAVDTDAAPETPRNRDYLEGFLAAKTGTAVGGEGSDLQADVIAALRETSILFATVIAVVVLKERLSPARIAAAGLIAVGAIVLRLA